MNKKYVVRMFSLLLDHIELTVTKDLNGALRSDLLLQKVIVTSEKINFSKIRSTTSSHHKTGSNTDGK